ncbi:CRISPR-associated endonuclease, Csn1 family [Pelagirhabdus alkalitolerans]|uniref:CRISPR-associated endonuclease Cas9 n=1 Tax=Pelagirhabdus alkalitolerans TaxID=1612202 RepID=A0A1G6H8K9_9BACI|nr:type II CRISPR RNA-guided endonuclease Cas9 [Pelagirhabdus alkalitolerans]SDB90551.1 CRISPR-associated endonuclease, Csn1 family [Pelagirhabdus alkalitolerans]
MKKKYTIGLDIGTNSVGWAVIRDDYDLIRKRMKINGDHEKGKMKKNFWGVRLFDEGETAEDRRIRRTTRRRLRRRRNRVQYLQSILKDELNRVDENFLHRLNESFYVPIDKEHNRHPIFGTLDEEHAYHKQFPTIYHLREYLANSNEQVDIRLVYLALAHIIKYRGHFLIEGELNTENSSVEETFADFLNHYNQMFSLQDDGSYINPLSEDISVEYDLTEKTSRSLRAENVLNKFGTEKRNGMLHQFLKLIVGNQGSFKKVFSLTEDRKLNMTKETYEEYLEELLVDIGEDYRELFLAAKNAHDAIELSDILSVSDDKTNASLSSSMVKRYEEHKQDLSALKNFIKVNIPDRYYDLFRNPKKNGYAGYIEGKTTEEDFYKYLKKELDNVEGAGMFLQKIDEERFLRKQRTYDNGVIPHQIHLEELRAIIEKQSAYYPDLLNHQEKIESLLKFRIPYYVGPLAKEQSKFAWIKRLDDTSIRPWNIEEKVDLIGSAESFINEMTNYDTYLPNEKVLPKHSFLIQKFNVYNELTKVQYVNDQRKLCNFSSHEKKEIYENLFKEKRTVSQKDLEDFLINEYQLENPSIKGIENKFNASLKTYHDFIKVGVPRAVLDNDNYENELEEIVKILTVFEDRKMIRQQLQKFSHVLDYDILKKLQRRHYTGWGRFSQKLIDGIRDEHTQKTILDYLIDDDAPNKNINRNFMQLINDLDLSFKKIIETAGLQTESDKLKDIVDQIPGSPAIKKGILQSLKIVDEIVYIMGYEPEAIVVEMARENQTTTQGQKNAKERLKRVEESLKDMKSDLIKKQPVTQDALQNDRLYLYYLQNGRDMYRNQELDINNLSNYDIDHIIPRSFTTDHSIDNRVLVSSKDNRGKSDDVPTLEVVKNMKPFWSSLYRSNLISKRKFDNLTKAERGRLTADDKAGFIKRQLVETRQITKHVSSILNERYNEQNTEENHNVKIIPLKSALTNQFRKAFDLYKVREINDYHHAHDAYLNAVIANLLLKVYPHLEPGFVYGEYRKTNMFKENKATAKKQFYSNLIERFKHEGQIIDENGEIVWDMNMHVEKIKRVLSYNQINIVKKVEIQTGNFSKETVQPKGESSSLIPRKKGWHPKKYGGFDSPNIAYSIIFTHEKGKKKKEVKEMIGITIMDQSIFEADETKYLEEKGYVNSILKFKLPKYSLFELENGRQRLLASANEAQKGNQLVIPTHLMKLLHYCNRYIDSGFKNVDYEIYLNDNRHHFSELLNHVLNFSAAYTLASANEEKIKKLYIEKSDQAEVGELATSFINLMDLNRMGAPSTFKFFGTNIERKRYTSIKELLDATIVFQSITGLHETRKEV